MRLASAGIPNLPSSLSSSDKIAVLMLIFASSEPWPLWLAAAVEAVAEGELAAGDCSAVGVPLQAANRSRPAIGTRFAKDRKEPMMIILKLELKMAPQIAKHVGAGNHQHC